MDKNYKYYAFISYSRQDEGWAMWLQHELEHYHLPDVLKDREDLPKEFRPIFRDVDELSAGKLPDQIYEALKSSENLIVICSPRAVKSKWVNKEITDFIEIGNEKGINNNERIFPFIIEGAPDAQQEAQECFPKALRGQEILAGNVNENGRDKAFVKIMAGMLPNVGFDDIWNRYERDKAEEERRKREERDKLLRAQSRYVAEKAEKLVEEGDSYLARRILIEVLHGNRPYTVEADSALRKSIQMDNSILVGHSGFVNSVSFSPDSKWIASASDDETIRIWNVLTGKNELVLRGHTDRVITVAYSPDGRRVVSASDDGTIRIWDALTGRMEAMVEEQHVTFIAISPDGGQIVSVSGEEFVRIWDMKTCQQVGKTINNRHTDGVQSVSFSPDGKYILSASYNTICIWRVLTGKLVRRLRFFRIISSATFSPDGKCILLTAGTTIQYWDVRTCLRKRLLKGHKLFVYSAAFHPNGKQIVSSSEDRTIRVWDIGSGKQLGANFQGHKRAVLDVLFSPNGKFVASASEDFTVRLWNIQRESLVCIPLNNYIHLTISDISYFDYEGTQNGESIATSSYGLESLVLKISNYFMGLTNRLFEYLCKMMGLPQDSEDLRRVTHAAFSPNHEQIVAALGNGTIRVWNVHSSEQMEVQIGEGKIRKINTLSFSPDGKFVLTTINSYDIRIWDVQAGRQVEKPFNVHDGHVKYAVISTDGKYLVSTSCCNVVRVWDVLNDIQVGIPFVGCMDKSVSLAISPDGEFVVFGLADGTICIWDVQTGKQVMNTNDGHADKILYLSFSSDGRFVASASLDNTIQVWDIFTRRKHGAPLIGHTGGVTYASFSPDGKYILSASEDRSIRVWDVQTSVQMCEVVKGLLNEDIVSVDYDAEGKQIMSVFSDGSVCTWVFPSFQELLDQTHERFKDRPLTLEERRMYYLE